MQTIRILIILFLQFGLAFNLQARNERERRELFSIINDELKELDRLEKSTRKSNPVLLLRKAELFLEKARLLREKENQTYLEVDNKLRRKKGKKSYFAKSRKMFMRAQKICEQILRKFKRFNKKYRVYYILGYNAQEFQNYKKSKKYFKKVLKYAPRDASVYLNSKIALVEMYYNDHQYNRAIPLYESLLENTKDSKWYTKYLYNLAWCHFRTGSGNRAINLMKKTYYLSKKSKYVNMSALAERDLGEFYADEKKMDEAIAFFKKNGKNFIESLLAVSKNLQEQGKYKGAERVLNEGKSKTKRKKDKIKIAIELLSLYENFENIPNHFNATKDLFEYYRNGDLKRSDKKILIYHLKRMSAKLQKNVVKEKNSFKRQKIDIKARYSVKYFDLLSEIEKTNKHKAIFFSAEVLYAVSKYDQASGRYYQSYQLSTRKRDEKIKKLALEGLLACLGKKVSEDTKKKYLKVGYVSYLKEYPRSSKTNLIYQRLFKIYRNEGNIDKSEEILLRYRSKFPKELKIQEAMLARVMDHHKEKKNRQGILKWVNMINSKKFVVSKKYANKVRQLLLNMRFEQVEKVAASGNNKKALNLYLKIYSDNRSGVNEKKNAAYNIAVILHELSYAKKSYQWTKKALEFMKPTEVKKFQSTFALITADIFGQRLFNEAAEINTMVFQKMCKQRSKYLEVFYKNSVLLYLAESNLLKAENIIEKGKNCRIKRNIQVDMKIELLRAFSDLERWSKVEKIIDNLSNNKKNYPRLIYPLSQLGKAYYNVGRKQELKSIKNRILKYYQHSKSMKISVPLEALDVVSELYLKVLYAKVGKLKNIKLMFPEKVYNARLKEKFLILDKITTGSLPNFSIGSGKGIVKTYKILIDSYQSMVNEILSFAPSGKSQEYVTSFRKSMKKIVIPLKAKLADFKIQASDNIRKHNILSIDNYQFISELKNSPFNIKYFPNDRGVLMDKGGRQ